jgi:hypothetical protein
MKRFAWIAMAMVLVMATGAAATAAELKVRGQVQAWARAVDNWDFEKSKSRNNNYAYEDDFTVEERARLFFDFVANKDLKFILQLQIGNGAWGQDGFGLGQGDGGTNKSTALRTRQAYLDFNVPDTQVNVKAGFFTLALPGYVGDSAILNEETSAIVATAPIIDKTLSVLVGYARLYDNTVANNTNNAVGTGFNSYGMRDEFDAAILALPVKFDGVEATPFFVYGWAGKQSLNDDIAYFGPRSGLVDAGITRGLLTPGLRMAYSAGTPYSFQHDLNAWWGGLATKLTMFDPIWFAFDFNYGSLSGGGSPNADGGTAWDNSKVNDRAGWLVDFAVGYNGLDFMKPKFTFAYTSGEDSDPTNGSERMPSLSQQMMYTPMWLGNSLSSSVGTMGAPTRGGSEHFGFWLLSLVIEKITYMENLSHDFTVAYIKGTNSASLLTDPTMLAGTRTSGGLFNYMPGHFLTTKDSLVEVDLHTYYNIFKELRLVMEAGYIFQSLDKDTWNTYLGTTDFQPSNAAKCMLGLVYDF